MATPAYALNDALQKLLAQPTGDRGYEPKPFVAVLWQFLAAVSESPGGIDVLRKHGTLVASMTALGSAYHKAVETAKALLDNAEIPAPFKVGDREFLHPLAKLASAKPEKSFLGPIEDEEDDLGDVLEDAALALSDSLRTALREWRSQAIDIIAASNLHHAVSCQMMLAMIEDKASGWGTGMLGTALGCYTASDIQEAAKAIADEIMSRTDPINHATPQTAKRRPPANEPRDRWIYEQCCKGVPYDTIAIQLKDKRKWEPILSKQGIQQAAVRYQRRNNLPAIPKRQEP